MKIPVFVSSPTNLNNQQNKTRKAIYALIKKYGLKPRALGQSDYPTTLPLREVKTIAKHCAGGMILGFEQQFAAEILIKRGVSKEKGGDKKSENISFPSPWNNLEAGILYSLGLPQLVFRDDGINGGIFDNGVSDVFVHRMPKLDKTGKFDKYVNAVFLKWQAEVRNRYYKGI